MDKDLVIKVRKELHNLPGKEREATLPITIMGATTNYHYSEEDCCFMWDDSAGIVYIVTPNTEYTHTTDSRLYPMAIVAIDYDEISFMYVPVDRLSLDNFMKSKVSSGLTNEETRKRYFKDMTDLYDDRTYFMGQPSPTTEKRGLRPDDEIVDVNATRFL